MFNTNKKIKYFVCVLVLANILVWQIVYDLSEQNLLEVCFLDVGQGSAALIKTKNNQQILIDGGPDNTILEQLRKKISWWDKTIDLVILTHAQKDHLYGLLEVLKHYRVKNILWTGIESDTNLFQEWENLIKKEGAEIRIAKPGLKIHLSDKIFLQTLWPDQNLAPEIIKDINNTSIVLKLNSYDLQILFPGDITKDIEYLLFEKGIDLKADVLQVPHHGSKYSSTELFLSEVNPVLAIISAGKNNPYRFPHQEVLERLSEYDIKVLSTINNQNICLIQKKKKPFFLLSLTE